MDWKSLFDRIGLNGTRWQWRMIRIEKSLQKFRYGLLHPEQAEFSLTKVIIGINLILFSIMVLQGAATGRGLSVVFRPDTELLLRSGAQNWWLVFNEGQWWRSITYAFTHGGLIHLGFNMFVLYQVGPLIEMEIGKARFMFLYVLTALTATLARLFWLPFVTVVGASGALFGLIGFAAAYYHRMGDSIALQRRNFMLQWAALGFIFGFLVPRIDNTAHLGGAVGGAVLGLLLPIQGRLLRSTNRIFNFLGLASVILVVLCLAILAWYWFAMWLGG